MKKKNWIWIGAAGITCCLAALVVCNRQIGKNASGKVFTRPDRIPYNRTGLVLGTTPKLNDGRPNLYFEYRMDAAAALYQAGKVKYLIISGDNHLHTYNEPEEMKKSLLARGVPQEALYLDYAGLRTLDSVRRAKEIFGQDSLTIISQRFHNERAIYLADAYGLQAVGYNAKDVHTYAGLKTRIRELFARVKVFVDLVTCKQPKHLGEKIPIPRS